MNKKLLSLALAGTIICAIPFNTYAESKDFIESSDSEINEAVNKVKVYKDAILIYTNRSNTNIRFYSDDDEIIKEGNTDTVGNLILDVYGYHDLTNEDHYLEIGSNNTRVYLNDENKVEIINGYYYDENADDDYDPTDAKEDDERVFPKYNFVENGNKITGNLEDYAFKEIRAYYDDKYIASSNLDKNGDFTISLNKPMRNREMMKFYVKYDRPSNLEIKPFEVNNTEYSVSGKFNKNIKIKAIYKDKVLGESVTDEKGIFTIETTYRLPSHASIKFYAESEAQKDTENSSNNTSRNYLSDSSNNSYIKGYEDNTFRPKGKITRAEAATMIARLLNGNKNLNNNSTKFSDSNNMWYSGAIDFVSNSGIISGYPGNKFMPNKFITRAEFVQMISNYLGNEVDGKSSFLDTEGHWAEDAIHIVSDKGYVKGYGNGEFKPNKEITRAEAVKILNETFSVKDNGIKNVKFNDVNRSDWFYNEIAKAMNM